MARREERRADRPTYPPASGLIYHSSLIPLHAPHSPPRPLGRPPQRRPKEAPVMRPPTGYDDTWKRAWLEAYPCDMPSVVPYPRVPLRALVGRAARQHPGGVACTLYGRPTTYAELDDQARRLAGALAGMGAGPGRHVGLLLPNIPEYLVALQGVWLTGATALQLSPLM